MVVFSLPDIKWCFKKCFCVWLANCSFLRPVNEYADHASASLCCPGDRVRCAEGPEGCARLCGCAVVPAAALSALPRLLCPGHCGAVDAVPWVPCPWQSAVRGAQPGQPAALQQRCSRHGTCGLCQGPTLCLWGEQREKPALHLPAELASLGDWHRGSCCATAWGVQFPPAAAFSAAGQPSHWRLFLACSYFDISVLRYFIPQSCCLLCSLNIYLLLLSFPSIHICV